MTDDLAQPGSAATPLVLTTLETHAAGEPLRIITGGLPPIAGATILERRRYVQDHLDWVRRALIWEPRGHADMYGAILTPPVTAEADLGVLFLHNAGYSTMCGHGVIALVTALFETGAMTESGPTTAVSIDTPAGLVRATAHHGPGGRVERVTFLNVPSFLAQRDAMVSVPGFGAVTLDIAFGGAFYAVLPAAALGLRVAPEQRAALIAAGEAVKAAVSATLPIQHPDEPDLGFLYGTIFTDTPEDPAHHSRNVCIFADGEVDRSPTGTGVSARLALHAAKGEIELGATILVESILGAQSVFSGRIAAQASVGHYPAVVPEIGGSAWVTGRSEFVLDPRDTLGAGFLVT